MPEKLRSRLKSDADRYVGEDGVGVGEGAGVGVGVGEGVEIGAGCVLSPESPPQDASKNTIGIIVHGQLGFIIHPCSTKSLVARPAVSTEILMSIFLDEVV